MTATDNPPLDPQHQDQSSIQASVVRLGRVNGVTVLQNLTKNAGNQCRRYAFGVSISLTFFQKLRFAFSVDQRQSKRLLLGKKIFHNRTTASEQIDERVIDLVNDSAGVGDVILRGSHERTVTDVERKGCVFSVRAKSTPKKIPIVQP